MPGNVLIIGNGVAGVTAARMIRKLGDDHVTIVSDETDHFYSRTALMYIYMGHMRYRDVKPYEDWFWEKNRIDLVRNRVEEIDTVSRRVRLQDGRFLDYEALLLATGSRPLRLDVPGADLPGVQGLYGMPDLERMQRSTEGARHAVVVGGGLIGVEMAEMLRSAGIQVTFLVRESSYMEHVLPPEESSMVSDEIRAHGVDLRPSTQLDEIRGRDRVESVVTDSGDVIDCDFVGIAVGVEPSIDFLRDSAIETNRGILVNEFFETNVEGVYAAGDCAEFREADVGHKAIEQLWYTARRHGQTVGRTIAGRRTSYDKGVYFNSAKFFDVEYQTYGQISARPSADEISVHWRDPGKRRILRINARRGDGAVTGFNALGTRLRQSVCERWILEKRPLDYVIKRLREASFDEECTPSFVRPDRAVSMDEPQPVATA